MSKLRLSLAFLACISFVGASNRKNDKVHWRGQPQKRALESRSEASVEEDHWSPGFRFLNNATKPYQVKSLPDVPYNVGEMYAGLVPIDVKNPSRALFSVFQPTIGAPVDEITIWLNGGPGCSSLEGFFQENGRFLWQPGQESPQLNPYSWVNLTNMLWVDQPVGTGFSVGEVTATSEQDIAQDFANWFLNWQKVFGIKNFKIYVTGESYAGRYVPYISAAMIDRNDTTHFDLSGALTYDPCIGATDYTQEESVAVPFVLENNNIMNLNDSFIEQIKALDESCGYADYREKYFQFPPPSIQPVEFYNYSTPEGTECDVFDDIINAALIVNPCFNIYHITDTCPLTPDVLGFPGSLMVTTPGLPIYFDRPDVKKAIHAPNITWSLCSTESVFTGPQIGPDDNEQQDTGLDSIQKKLPQVIEHTNRVLVANGDLDFIIITNGTLLAIQNMTWNGKLGFQEKPSTPIIIDEPDLQYGALLAENGYVGLSGTQGDMGIQHYERGLMWAQTYLSGHEQPEYQPRSSYRHLQWVLGRINEL